MNSFHDLAKPSLAVLAAAAALALAATACGGSGIACALGGCDVPPIAIALEVAVADFNGDGHPDVALPQSTGITAPGFVAVYLHGSQVGTAYNAGVNYPVDKDPYSITAADLDGDGRPDLITTSFHSDSVSVILNRAASPGSFAAPQNLPAQNVSKVVVADMDGDGRPDLVISANPLLLAVQQPGQPGTFAAPTPLHVNPSGKTFGSIAVGDLDGDGLTDVVVADDDEVKVLFHAAGATNDSIASTLVVFTNTRSGESPTVAIGDVDGDGRNDIVIADPDGGALVVLWQDPAAPGHFLAPLRTLLPVGASYSLALADLNGDGRLDVVSGGSTAVAVFLQDPARRGTFLAAQTYPVPLGADGVAVADVEGNGVPDIVTSSGTSSAMVNGVLVSPPGVLYADPARPGAFLPLANIG